MHIYEAKELAPTGIRSFPWRTSLYDQRCRYYDFKATPELIPEVLEDFRPWVQYPAIRDFYAYLTWLNGSESELESDDCAFSGVEKNLSTNLCTSKFQASGRLMLFFRTLAFNCDQQNSEWLFKCFWFYLERVEHDLSLGVIGLSNSSTEFIALNRQQGRSLVLNFWAWGETEPETMDNLQRVFRRLHQASNEVCTDIRAVADRSASTRCELSGEGSPNAEADVT